MAIEVRKVDATGKKSYIITASPEGKEDLRQMTMDIAEKGIDVKMVMPGQGVIIALTDKGKEVFEGIKGIASVEIDEK